MSPAALLVEPAPASLTDTRTHWSLAAGLVDAGLSSLASFTVGLAALHLLSPGDLGMYALFTQAFILAQLVPATLIYAAVEVWNVDRTHRQRLSILRWSIPRGMSAALVTSVLVFGAVLVPSHHSLSLRFTLALLSIALAVSSSAQDHIRRVLHQGRYSWNAAAVSLTQLVAAATVVLLAVASPLPRATIPFVALIVANGISAAVGWRAARRHREPAEAVPTFRAISGTGGWLAIGGFMGSLGTFLISAALIVRAGSPAAGYAEAARVLAQPLSVLGLGTSAVAAPIIMTAYRTGNGQRAQVMARQFLMLVMASGLLWTAFVGWSWRLNPLPELFPVSYAQRGLLIGMTMFVTIYISGYGYVSLLTAAGRARRVAVTDITVAAGSLALVTAISHRLGAYSVAIAGILSAAVRLISLALAARGVARAATPVPDDRGKESAVILRANDDDQPKMRAGVKVRVRPFEQIVATLDPDATLEGLPFQPEMLAFCGKTLPVSAVAHKTCDTIAAGGTTRSLPRTVHLTGARCDGSAHGGCQAECLFFWKTAWLEPVTDDDPTDFAAEPMAAESVRAPERCSSEDVHAATRAGADSHTGEQIWSCQATRLRDASTYISSRDVRQYLRDVTTGNVRLRDVLRGLALVAGDRLLTRSFARVAPHREKNPPRLLPRVSGTLARTPKIELGLQPGEEVEVKSLREIQTTLDKDGRNRGLSFDTEMAPYCNKRMRVRRRVKQIIDERSGRMLRLESDCLILDDATCQALYHRFCPRQTYSFWREAWLRRVQDAPEAESAGDRKYPPRTYRSLISAERARRRKENGSWK